MSLADLFDSSVPSKGSTDVAALFDVSKTVPAETPKVAPKPAQQDGFAWNPFEGVGDFIEGAQEAVVGAWDWGKKAVHSIGDWGEGFLTNKIEDRGIADVEKFNKYQEDISLMRDPQRIQDTYKKMQDEGIISQDYFTRAENVPEKKELDINAKEAQEAKSSFRKELEESVKDMYSAGDRMQMKWLNAGIEEFVSEYENAYNNISMSYDNSQFSKKEWIEKLNSDFKENLKKTFKGFADNISKGDDDTKALDNFVATNTDTASRLASFGEDLMIQSNKASREEFLSKAGFFNAKQLWNTLQYAGTWLTEGSAYLGEGLELIKEKALGRYDVSEELRNLDVYRDSASAAERYMGKLGYWAGELIDGAPTLVPLIGTIAVGEAGLARIPAIANMASKGKAANFAWDMFKDMTVYDHVAQVAMGRGNNVQDALENSLFNLPINLGINLLHVPVKDTDEAFDKFFGIKSKTPKYTADGYITKDALDALKEGDTRSAAIIEASNRAKGVQPDIDATSLNDGLQKQIADFKKGMDESIGRKQQGSAATTADDEHIWIEATKIANSSRAVDPIGIKERVKDMNDALEKIKSGSEAGKQDMATISSAVKNGTISQEEVQAAINTAVSKIDDYIPRSIGISSNQKKVLSAAKDVVLQFYTGADVKDISVPITAKMKSYIDQINASIVADNILLKDGLPDGTTIREFVSIGNSEFLNKFTGKVLNKSEVMKEIGKNLPKSAPDTLYRRVNGIMNSGNFTDYNKLFSLDDIAIKNGALTPVVDHLKKMIGTYDPMMALSELKKNIDTGMQKLSVKQYWFLQAMLLEDLVAKLSLKGDVTPNTIMYSDLWKMWSFHKGEFHLNSGVANPTKLNSKISATMKGGEKKEIVDELSKTGGQIRLANEIVSEGEQKVLDKTISKSKSKAVKEQLELYTFTKDDLAAKAEGMKVIEDIATDDVFSKLANDLPEEIQMEYIQEMIDANIKKNSGGVLIGKNKKQDIKMLKDGMDIEDTIESKLKAVDTLIRTGYGINDTAFVNSIQDLVSIGGSETIEKMSKEALFDLVDRYVAKFETVKKGNVKIGTSTTLKSDAETLAEASRKKLLEERAPLKTSYDKAIFKRNKLQESVSKLELIPFNSMTAPQKAVFMNDKRELNSIQSYINETFGKLQAMNSELEKLNEVFKKSENASDAIASMMNEFAERIKGIKESGMNIESKFRNILMAKFEYSKKFYGQLMSDKRILVDEANKMMDMLSAARSIDFIKSDTTSIFEFVKTAEYEKIRLTSQELTDLRYPKFSDLENKKKGFSTVNAIRDNKTIKLKQSFEYDELPGRKMGEKTFSFDSNTNRGPISLNMSQLKEANIFKENTRVVFILGERLGESIIKDGKGIVEASIENARISTASFESFLKSKLQPDTVYILGKEHYSNIVSQRNGVISVSTSEGVEHVYSNFLNNKNLFVSDIDLFQYVPGKVAMYPADQKNAKTLFKEILFSDTYSAEYSLKGTEGFTGQGYRMVRKNVAGKGTKEYKVYDKVPGMSSFSVSKIDNGKNAAFLMKTLNKTSDMMHLAEQVKNTLEKAGFKGNGLIDINKALDIIGISFGSLGPIFRQTMRTMFTPNALGNKMIELRHLLATEELPYAYIEHLKTLPGDSSVLFGGIPAYEVFNDILIQNIGELNYGQVFEKMYKGGILGGMDISEIRKGIYGVMRTIEGYSAVDMINQMNPHILENIFPGLDMYRIQALSDKIIGVMDPKGAAENRSKFNSWLIDSFRRSAEITSSTDAFVIKFLEELQKKGLLSTKVDIYTMIDSLGALKDTLGQNLKRMSSGNFMRLFMGKAGDESAGMMEGIKKNIKQVVDELEGRYTTAEIEDAALYKASGAAEQADEGLGAMEIVELDAVVKEDELAETGREFLGEGYNVGSTALDYESIIEEFVGNMKKYTGDMESNLVLKGDYSTKKLKGELLYSDPLNYKLMGASITNPSWKTIMDMDMDKIPSSVEGWLKDVKGAVSKNYKVDRGMDVLDKLHIGHFPSIYGDKPKEAVKSFLEDFGPEFIIPGKKIMAPADFAETEEVISGIFDSILVRLEEVSKSIEDPSVKPRDTLFEMRLRKGEKPYAYHEGNINLNPLWKAYTADMPPYTFYKKMELLEDKYLQRMRFLFDKLSDVSKAEAESLKGDLKKMKDIPHLKAYANAVELNRKSTAIMDNIREVYGLNDSGRYTGIDDIYHSKAYVIENELLKPHVVYNSLKLEEGILEPARMQRGIDMIFEEGIRIGDYRIKPEDILDVKILGYTPIFQNSQTLQMTAPTTDIMKIDDIVPYMENMGYGWKEVVPGIRNIGEGKGLPDLNYEMRLKFLDEETGKTKWVHIDSSKSVMTLEQKIDANPLEGGSTGKKVFLEGSQKEIEIFMDSAETVKEFGDGFPNASCQGF